MLIRKSFHSLMTILSFTHNIYLPYDLLEGHVNFL